MRVDTKQMFSLSDPRSASCLDVVVTSPFLLRESPAMAFKVCIYG